MSILTKMISNSRFTIQDARFSEGILPPERSAANIRHFPVFTVIILTLVMLATAFCKPKEDVQLRKINDIVVDASTEPVLRANAILYNPNNLRMTVKKIDLEVFVDGKKAAIINQKLKIRVPANNEFTIPLEVKLNLKEMGLMDTMFAIIGGKRMQIHYKGHIRLQKSGVPFNVPVNYKEEIRIRL
jgi:LEA14-like dessication related protein